MTSSFIFERYAFDSATGVLHLHYRYDGGAHFEERITFPSPVPDLPSDRLAALDRAFRLIFLLAGVSYYKAFVPRDLICEAFPLDKAAADFVARVYRNGLGEFAWRNRIDLSDKINFAVSDAPESPSAPLSLPRRLLVPVGGGKDSIVSLELLKQAGFPVTLYAQGKAADDIAAPIQATIAASGLPALKVGRVLSEALLELNKAGALNGHVPITAILSSITIACAILYGFDTIVLSNERSASAPNLIIGGTEINHQYSKSLAFEADLSAYIAAHIAPDLRYFSLLRPLTEAAIARRFAKAEKYHAIFRSCNTAFRQDEKRRGTNWCCDCPKCRFVFLALAPFMDKRHLIGIFGKNMLDDETQKQGFAELCGLAAHKPFECVGEIEESALLLEKLRRSAAWQSDCVVQELGDKLAAASNDFDARFSALFVPHSEHRVPEEFLRLLHAYL
ncbi:MAG: endonuclease domain-containing protein [Alphaproteobacteria bacterium]|nr:endonuclease domain-containing protein [Alphaproteobacteria bacterium]